MRPIYHNINFDMRIQKGEYGRLQIPKLVCDIYHFRDGMRINLNVNRREFRNIKLTSGKEVLLGRNTFPQYEIVNIRIDNPRLEN